MEQQEKYSWLDEFLISLEQALGAMDLTAMQPTSWRHTHPLFAREWLEWFERIIGEAKRQNISTKKLAYCLSPALWRLHLGQFILEDMKTSRWPKEKRLEMVEFFYPIMQLILDGDYFALKGTNKILSPVQILSLFELEFLPGTESMAKQLGKLYTAAYNLAAALYLDYYMDAGIENHGPYSLENNRILVVKEMRGLQPQPIWPEISTEAQNLTLYAVYENMHFSLDLICCHSQYSGSTITNLKQWRLEKDGKPVTDSGAIEKITRTFTNSAKEQWLNITSMPEQELIQKSVWIRCYIFKPVCDLLGMDWKPTKDLLDAVKGKTFAQGFSQWEKPVNEKVALAYWRRIWDPRIDFYPKTIE